MKKLKIIKAKNSGYCFGVKRALNITEEILAENINKNLKIFTLGSIIHNSGVANELAGKGLISAEDPSEIVPGSIFIIRSHGMPPELIKELKKNANSMLRIILSILCMESFLTKRENGFLNKWPNIILN